MCLDAEITLVPLAVWPSIWRFVLFLLNICLFSASNSLLWLNVMTLWCNSSIWGLSLPFVLGIGVNPFSCCQAWPGTAEQLIHSSFVQRGFTGLDLCDHLVNQTLIDSASSFCRTACYCCFYCTTTTAGCYFTRGLSRRPWCDVHRLGWCGQTQHWFSRLIARCRNTESGWYRRLSSTICWREQCLVPGCPGQRKLCWSWGLHHHQHRCRWWILNVNAPGLSLAQ